MMGCSLRIYWNLCGRTLEDMPAVIRQPYKRVQRLLIQLNLLEV